MGFLYAIPMKSYLRFIRKVHILCSKSTFLATLLVALVFCCSTRKEDVERTDTKGFIADSVYLQEGNKIVSLTFDTLRNSLVNSIKTQGIEGAISFCNQSAYPITSIYADSVVIRRTSMRVRNSNNKPDSLELLILEEMNELMRSSNMPTTKVVRQKSTGEIHFFKPIILQAMCLNCHGTPGVQIQKSTLGKIRELYQDDRAVSYKEGDLRGVWHIIFKEQNKH